VADSGSGFDAGPNRPCPCDGGCCGADGGCLAPYVFTTGPYKLALTPCGNNGFTCDRLCTFPYANQCANNQCRCGNGPACAVGEFCNVSASGVASCICDFNTGCQGCCASSGRCQRGDSDAECGRAGLACAACPDGGAVLPGRACSKAVDTFQYGVCNPATPCGLGSCASGKTCLNAIFPRCRAPGGSNACYSCDQFRANRCDPTAFDGTGCACGVDDRQCGPNELCDRPLDGGPAMCRLFQ
jgi:hypothetical protein